MKPRKSSPGYRKVMIFIASTALCALLTTACGNANKHHQPSEETTESSNPTEEKALQAPIEYSEELVDFKPEGDTLTVAPKMPEFPGGHEALLAYLEKNMQYPPEAQRKGIQGRVFIQFVVGKDGSILSPR